MRNLLDIIRLRGKAADRNDRHAEKRAVPVRRMRSTSSRKVWYTLSLSGAEMLTPWARNEKARRRAAGRTAKQARKVNRRYRATGGLR